MRFLQNVAALVSVLFLATGVYDAWTYGLNERGLQVLVVASSAALVLALAFYVFHLRGRIIALEKQSTAAR